MKRRGFLKSLLSGVSAIATGAVTAQELLPKPKTVAQLSEPLLMKNKAKFFDTVSYVGNGNSQVIEHGLSMEPGMIVVKRRDAPQDWVVYNKDDEVAGNRAMEMSNDAVNEKDGSYIAYLFAHAV
jgi:hypothetical protein